MSDDLPQDGSSLPGTDQQSLTNKAARVDDLPRYGFICELVSSCSRVAHRGSVLLDPPGWL